MGKMGAQTAEANNNCAGAAAKQIVDFFAKGDVSCQVNRAKDAPNPTVYTWSGGKVSTNPSGPIGEGRKVNFGAGPCCLPYTVLMKAQDELCNFNGTGGMSVMEMSHRGKDFDGIIKGAEKDIRELLKVPDNFKVMFLQGGATTQFASVALNLLGLAKRDGKPLVGDYIVTGQWGDKAAIECNKYIKGKLLVGDHSSDFMSRSIDWSKHALVYAGAQKNVGPAGNTVVIVREDCIGAPLPECPTAMDYKVQADGGSMYNTPACYPIYMMGLVLKHMKAAGGIEHFEKLAEQRSTMLYDCIDNSNGYYKAPVEVSARSRVNVPFIMKGDDADTTKKFLAEAEAEGMTALAGHRSVGGCRASIYNAMPMEGVAKLCAFMKRFQAANP